MSSVFSEYVRLLSIGESPGPDAELFESILETLRGALIHELKKRGLWTVSPRYLGIYGGGHWDAGDSLEELLFGCYEFIFVRRLSGLCRQLEKRSNIDGLVFLNIQHFLHEAQRRHDPLGFRVYELVRAAIESLTAAGVIYVLVGEPPLRNSTVLGFAPWLDAERTEPLDLRSQVSDWCNELMPELVTAWSKETVVSRLAERVGDLSEKGVEVFRFGDLMNPLKLEIRGRWAALWIGSQGELALENEGDSTRLVRTIKPNRAVEEQQGFSFLMSCVSEGLGQLENPRKTRGYLQRLFRFLHMWAAEFEPGEPRDRALDGEFPSDELPSDKRLGELLEIPRGRFKDLKATLGSLIKTCRESEVATTLVASPAERKQSLIYQTLQTSARVEEARRLIFEGTEDGPRPGDMYQLPSLDEVPVDWLLVEIDRRFAAVLAVDDRPMLGSSDVGIGSLRVRCAQEVEIAPGLLEPEGLIGRVEEQALERILSKRRSIREDDVRAGILEWETDDDSEYGRWLRLLETAVASLRASSAQGATSAASKVVPIESDRAVKGPPTRRSNGWIYPMAAMLALSVLGLSYWTQELGRQIDRLSEPFAIRSSATYDIRFHDTGRTADLHLEATESHILIYLVLSRVEVLSSYRLELLEDPKGARVWRSSAIAYDREILLVLPRTVSNAETYRLRLYGQKEGDEVLLDEQRFSIERKQFSAP